MSTTPTSERIAVDWLREGRRVVGATLVETIGSAPLDPGAQMLIDDQINIEGSVTGGCVEGALVEEARGILAGNPPAGRHLRDLRRAGDGRRPDVRRHGAGLRPRAPAARPSMRSRLWPMPAPPTSRSRWRRCWRARAPAPRWRSGSDRAVGSLGVTELLDRSVERDARGQLDEGLSRIRRYGADGAVMGADLAVYIQAFSTQPRMIIFGAIDFSAEMAKLASERRLQGHDLRRPRARSCRARGSRDTAEVVVDWPDRYLEGRDAGRPRRRSSSSPTTPKFDEPALDRGAGNRRRVRRRARQPPHPGAPDRAPARRRARR